MATMGPNPPAASKGRRPRPGASRHGNVVELLPPGSFVKLVNQPADLPPFQLIHCKGGRCWVRQQAWGQLVQWEVPHRRLTKAS
ncbi:MAG: hypothetical protein VKM98_09705 [Cyanobacteriota bacterium]|nr:hypothetical protein [Cyanobacteriota bacterium]